MLKPRSEFENRAATRREALPNFCGKTATIILADKKLQVVLLFLTGYKAFSVVENQKSDSFSFFYLLYLYTASVLLLAM